MSSDKNFSVAALAFVIVILGLGDLRALDLFGVKKEGRFSFLNRHPENETSKSHLLQQEMMDYSDRFTMAVWEALDQYIRNETDPQKRSAAEHWKVLYSAASMQIASGRDPAGSLLDMAVLTDLACWSVAESWNPQVFGKGGEPLLDALHGMKKDLGGILDATITTEQRQQLNVLIAGWKQHHSGALYVSGIRLDDLASTRAGKEEKSGGLILIADVSRAVGKVDKALQYGERAMFYLERLPRLTTMQTSLALAQAGSAPAVVSLTGSAEKASLAITQLPDKVTAALATNAATVKELLPGVQGTVTESRKLAESVERMMAVGSGTESVWTPGKCSQVLEQTRASSLALRDTLKEANQTLAYLGGGGSLIDEIFYRVLIVIGLLLAGIAGLIVLFRRLK